MGRVMCMAEANGVLYAACGIKSETPSSGGLFRRVDGEKPRWELLWRWPHKIQEQGDEMEIMRGLTAVADPKGGAHQVLLGTCNYPGVVYRIDPSPKLEDHHRVGHPRLFCQSLRRVRTARALPQRLQQLSGGDRPGYRRECPPARGLDQPSRRPRHGPRPAARGISSATPTAATDMAASSIRIIPGPILREVCCPRGQLKSRRFRKTREGPCILEAMTAPQSKATTRRGFTKARCDQLRAKRKNAERAKEGKAALNGDRGAVEKAGFLFMDARISNASPQRAQRS